MTTSTEYTSPTGQPDGNRPRIFYGWWIVAGAGAMLALNNIVSYSLAFVAYEMGSLYPGLTFDGADHGGLGIWGLILYLMPFSLIGYVIVAPFAGAIVDRKGPKPLILGGVLLTSLGLVLLSQTSSREFSQFAMVTIGLGTGLCATIVLTATVVKWFVHRRALALSIMLAISVVLPLFWVIPSSLVYPDWRLTLIVVSVSFLAVGIPVALTMKHKPERHGMVPDGKRSRIQPRTVEVSATFRSAVRLRAFWHLAIIVGLLSFLIISDVSGFRLDVINRNLFSGVISAYGSLFAPLIGILAFGFVGDRFDKRSLLTWLLIWQLVQLGIAAVLISIPSDGQYLVHNLLVSVLLEILLIGLSAGTGFLAPLTIAILADYLGRRRFGSMYGIFSSAGTILGQLIWLTMALTLGLMIWAIGFWSPGHITSISIYLLALVLVRRIEHPTRIAARIRLANRFSNYRPTP